MYCVCVCGGLVSREAPTRHAQYRSPRTTPHEKATRTWSSSTRDGCCCRMGRQDAILFNLLSKEALRRVRDSDAALPKFMKVCRASLASLGPGGPGILAMTLYASKTLKTFNLDTCSAEVIHAVAESLKENTVLGHLRSGLEDLK